jgi:hypothetical protein
MVLRDHFGIGGLIDEAIDRFGAVDDIVCWLMESRFWLARDVPKGKSKSISKSFDSYSEENQWTCQRVNNCLLVPRGQDKEIRLFLTRVDDLYVK